MNSIWSLRLLRLICLLALAGSIFFLTQLFGREIAESRSEIRFLLKRHQSLHSGKTPREVEEARLAADAEWAKATKMREQAFKDQEDLFFWPEEVEKEFNFRSGLFAQRITVFLGNAKLPEDGGWDDRRLQGTVVEAHPNFIVVEDADKERHKVHASKKVENDVKVEGSLNLTKTHFGSIHVGDRVQIAFHRGKYFYEPLTNAELASYVNPREVYLKQVDEIISQVEPMNAKGEGVVQLKGWFYDKDEIIKGQFPLRYGQQQKFLVCLESGWVNVGTPPTKPRRGQPSGPLFEEAWLAQEDLWIQKEIYRLIRAANDSINKFANKDTNDSGDGVARMHVFRNPLLEFALSVTKHVDGQEQLSMKIKNLENRRQSLDFKIRVHFVRGAESEMIDIGETSIGPRGAADCERTVVRQLPPKKLRQGIYAVEQVLTWQTAAVKRIDAVNIASLAPDEYAHSHRTFADNQVALRRIDPSTLPSPKTPTPAAGGSSDRLRNEFTRHYLIRNRYCPPLNPAFRRVPVSMVLIVNPNHVDRVLTAFNNSRLRFLTTQFLINRYTGSTRPYIVDENALRRPAGIRFISPPPPTEEPETDIELVLYGIVTLYERFPPPLD